MTGTGKFARGKARTAKAHLALLMDRVMSGGRGRVGRAPRVLAEHRLTGDQIRDVGSKVALRHISGKGLGLVARRALPAHTRIGVYGGKVYSASEHEQLTGSGATTGKYAIDFYKRSRDGKPRGGYIMDPGVRNIMHPTHANVLAAFINEPASHQVPNVVWVRNYESDTMELWTTRAVRAGEEVTVCYGADYPRKYKTPCTSQGGFLHYVSESVPRPMPLR